MSERAGLESPFDAPPGVVYTLATGRLFCPFSDFQEYAERVLDRPILTHEFADQATWEQLREAFEKGITRLMRQEARSV